MGIISFFKDIHYQNKLENAEKLFKEGKVSEAERILVSILDKHPLAARKLAVCYGKLASKADIDTAIKLYNKTIAIRGKAGGVCDVISYEEILNSFAGNILKRATACFDSESYSDCSALLSALNATQCKSETSVNLYFEAQIRLTLEEIMSVKATDSRFNTLINKFNSEWSVGKGISRANKYCVDFCNNLESKKRYYASNAILKIILNGVKNFKFLDNVVEIVSGHDQEADSNMLKATVSNYGKDVVFRDGIAQDVAVEIFDKCWIVSKDCDFAIDVLKSVRDKSSMRDAIIAKIISNHSSYLTNSVLLMNFCRWLSDNIADQQAIQLFEKLHYLGYGIEVYYVAQIHSLIASMSCDDKVNQLDHALTLFPNSYTIIDDKFECAKWYLNNNEYEKAISIADTLIPKTEKARLVKSHAIYNISKGESDLDKRVELLNKAKDVLGDKIGTDFEAIGDSILSDLLDAAEHYYLSKDFDKSFDILHNLANDGCSKAVVSIAKHRLDEIRACVSVEKKQKTSYEAIAEISQFQNLSIKDVLEYQYIWDEHIVSYIDNRKILDNESAVRDLEALLKEISKARLDASIIKDKQDIVIKEIIRRKYLIARELESGQKIDEAINLYKDINSLESKQVPTLSALRFIICKLKLENNADIIQHSDRIYSMLKIAPTSFKAEKEDAAYRFALILLKSGEDKKALEVLSEFLPDETYLKNACLQGSMIKAQAKLEEFNSNLEAVKNNTLSSEDAIFFLNHLLEYSEAIEPILQISRQTLGKYRSKLKNYAIYKLFNEDKYAVAFEKLLKEHSDYLDDLTALRNIALTCLNMAETKQVSTANYREVISIWLTAIYQERVFVKSLDYTSWDDPYTFSLYDAYGHFDKNTVGELPENVNFDEIDDKIISIKEVQRTLLDRFEAAISDNQQYHEFYIAQKDAMDSFISLNLDVKCRIVVPYLMNKNKDVYNGIVGALEQERKQQYDNLEDVLSVGAVYNIDKPAYTKYGNAKMYYNNCMEALNSSSKTKVKQAFTVSGISSVRDYKKLYSALVSSVDSKLSALSHRDTNDFDDNYDYYLPICNAIKDNTLSFNFSKYVMRYVVNQVNDDNMELSKAADYILNIYLLDCNNGEVKENIKALFNMLVLNPTSENNRAVSNILTKIKTKDPTLYNQFKKTEENASVDNKIREIANKMHSNSMSAVVALDKVYALYNEHKNNSIVCKNLAQLCVVCIMNYIVADKIERYKVESTLDNLCSNISDEFRKNNSDIRIAFNDIWSQLDSQTKQLMKQQLDISFSLTPNTPILNSKGKALREGLRYMATLGKKSNQETTVFDY